MNIIKSSTLLIIALASLTACQSYDIAERASQVATSIADLQSTTAESPPTFDCERKTCGEMNSCQEALYKLRVCGHRGLDRGGEKGVPCETFCTKAEADNYSIQPPPATEPPPTTAPPASTISGEIGTVTRVIDGDTIDVLVNGRITRIRYLQMNTPERGEPCFREATQANANLVQGQTVRLVPDTALIDPFDRWLRFVYVGDLLVNRLLVAQGYAEVVLFPPNDALYGDFLALERAAAQDGRGCHPTGVFNDGSTRR